MQASLFFKNVQTEEINLFSKISKTIFFCTSSFQIFLSIWPVIPEFSRIVNSSCYEPRFVCNQPKLGCCCRIHKKCITKVWLFYYNESPNFYMKFFPTTCCAPCILCVGFVPSLLNLEDFLNAFTQNRHFQYSLFFKLNVYVTLDAV